LIVAALRRDGVATRTLIRAAVRLV
jgi:hypothetical protein